MGIIFLLTSLPVGNLVIIEMDKFDAHLLLNGLSNIGPITAKNLIEFFDNCPEAIFRANRHRLSQVKGWGRKLFLP